VGEDLGSGPPAIHGSHPLDLAFQTLTSRAVDLDAPTGLRSSRKTWSVDITHPGKIFIDIVDISHTHRHLDDVVEGNPACYKNRLETLQTSATLCFNPCLASPVVGFAPSCPQTTTELPAFIAGDNEVLDRGAAAVVTTVRALVSSPPGLGQWSPP